MLDEEFLVVKQKYLYFNNIDEAFRVSEYRVQLTLTNLKQNFSSQNRYLK